MIRNEPRPIRLGMVGGCDPLEGLRRHADRVWHVPFKDHDPAVAAESRRAGWGGVEAVAHGVFTCCRVWARPERAPSATATISQSLAQRPEIDT